MSISCDQCNFLLELPCAQLYTSLLVKRALKSISGFLLTKCLSRVAMLVVLLPESFVDQLIGGFLT